MADPTYLRALGLASILTWGAGCGPMLSTTVMVEAEQAIEQADELSADRYAVYEYASAVEYLAKSREEWGRSDFQHAIEYARRAAEFAELAYERALRDPARPATPAESAVQGARR